MTSPIDAVQSAVVAFLAAFNNKDAKAYAAAFAHDGEFTNVFGQSSIGHEAIETRHSPFFREPQTPGLPSFVHATTTILESRIRLLRPDVSTADVKWKQIGAIAPNGQPWGDRLGLMSLVLTLENDAWLIASMHNMDLHALPPQRPS